MTHSLVLGGGGGGDEEAAVACMEVDAEDQARTIGPSVLNSLPFPIGWQLVCDCLPTSDIRYFGAASCDCKAHTRPCVRRLPIRGPLPADDAATDSSDRTLSALTSLVASCPRVEEVQGVELGPVGAAHLGWAWAAHPASLAHLRCLALPGCMIGEPGLCQLLPMLGYMPCLELLNLDANGLGSKGARALARALLQLPIMMDCDVNDCKESDAVPRVELDGRLPQPATVPCSSLKVLSLALNGIGSGGAADLAAALVPSSSSSSSSASLSSQHPCEKLTVLNLDGNVLGPGGTAALARAFRSGACRKLRELHLRNNDVRGEGLRELLGAFAAGACPDLSTFNLSSNILGSSGALFLARAFRNGACRKLQVLNVNATYMGEAGTRELAGAFKDGACRALQRLYLGSASVRDAGVHELVAALQQSSSVKEKLQVLVLGRCTSITIVILHHDVLRGEAIHPAHDAAYGGEEVMYPLLEPGSGVVGEYGV